MTLPSRARQDLRLDVLKILDPISEPKSSSATSDSDSLTVLIDTLLAPMAQSEDYVGDYIYVRTQPIGVDSTANIDEGGQFSASDTTLTVTSSTPFAVGDGIQFSATGTAAGEICRVITITDGTTIEIVRGIQGTTASTHENADNIFIIGPAVGETAQVTNVTFGSSNSKLTVEPGFSASLISGAEYERHAKVRPSVINDRLDVILGVLRQNVLLPVTIVTDGDMELTDTVSNSWTKAGTGGTPTLAKNTTFVRRGRQSLSITNDGSTTLGYAKSASMYLNGGTKCIVEADVYITPGDLARLTFYDVTNSAVIGTAMESDESGWVHLENTFVVPETCEEVQVWLESQAVSDVTYWDHVVVWPVLDQGIELPAFLEFAHDVQRIMFIPVGLKIDGSTNVDAYRINEGAPMLWAHYRASRDTTGVVPARLYLSNKTITNALWVEARKSFSTFSGSTDAVKDTATTTLHRHIVANMTAASIIDDFALDATAAEKFTLAERLMIKAATLRFDVQNLILTMTPPKRKKVTDVWSRAKGL